MLKENKIRISSQHVDLKVLGIVFIFFTLKLLIDNINTDLEFKTITEFRIYFIVSILFSMFFFTRPAVYHDDLNLYIKRFIRKEEIIELQNVKSIYVSWLGGRGTYNNTIEYLDIHNSKKRLRFNSNNRLSNFINQVKINNPRAEII